MQFQTPPDPIVLAGNKKKLKWAVGCAGGPRSRTWVVMAHRRNKDNQHNVYVGAEQHMGAVKLSLHEPSTWQIGYTSEYVRDRWPGLKRRVFSQFAPPSEIAPGWRRAAIVLIPATSLVQRGDSSDIEANKIQWWPAPPATDHLQFHILISEGNGDPSISVKNVAGAVGVIRFGSRWSVSVLATTVVLTDQELALIESQREEARAENAEGLIGWGVVEDDGTPHLIDL